MDAYVGEIRMFGGNYAPSGWLFCNGQQLPISQYEALYSLIGTTYGGDGVASFNLPNLQGRIPVGQGLSLAGTNYLIGMAGGTENVTLLSQQLPAHTHTAAASTNPGTAHSPAGAVWAAGINEYAAGGTNSAMNAASLAPVGGSQPHNNVMPFTCVSFIISYDGIWPSPN